MNHYESMPDPQAPHTKDPPVTEPRRRLVPPLGGKPHRYVPASHTDIRRTFRRERLLKFLQQRSKGSP